LIFDKNLLNIATLIIYHLNTQTHVIQQADRTEFLSNNFDELVKSFFLAIPDLIRYP